MPAIKNNNPTLIFFHIGRTAGTTLRRVILRKFPKDSYYFMNTGVDPDCVEKLKQLPFKDKEKIRCLHGHMVPMGIHKHLPHPSVYFTMIRHPIARINSIYSHGFNSPDHLNYRRVQNLSLHNFVARWSSLAEIDNGQTRILSGIAGKDWVTGAGPIDGATLECAKENLKNTFLLVGLVERFDESLLLLKRKLGWGMKDILYKTRNVSSNKSKNISKETIKLIEKHNKFDLELYKFAEKYFEKAIELEGPSFRKELQIFRVLNKIYVCIYNAAYWPYKTLGLQKIRLAISLAKTKNKI